MPPAPAGHVAADEHPVAAACALGVLAGGGASCSWRIRGGVGRLAGAASPSESIGGPPDMGVYDIFCACTHFACANMPGKVSLTLPYLTLNLEHAAEGLPLRLRVCREGRLGRGVGLPRFPRLRVGEAHGL